MYLERYLRGEYEKVWFEIRHLSQSTLTTDRATDIESVAVATMQRVATNIDILVDHLVQIGWHFATPQSIRILPTDQDVVGIEQIENVIGPLPIALKACLLFVGGVHLAGSFPGNERPTYLFGETLEQNAILADPLSLPTGYWLDYSYQEWREDHNGVVPFHFEFAPDEYHKANYSGGSHMIQLPKMVIDPVIEGVHNRPQITLVEYLRTSIRWCGFPGYEFEPSEEIPPALADISSRFIPF